MELGGQLAGTSKEATHLVMGGSTATRSVKFLCAMSCSQYIVSLQWVVQSHANSRFLREYIFVNLANFLLILILRIRINFWILFLNVAEDDYIVEMAEFEKLFEFSLRESLKRQFRRQLFAVSWVLYLDN